MGDEIRCIYCHSPNPDSEEHAIPECLGEFRGFSVIKDRICKRCNNKIGKEEEQFCRSGPESFFRELLGIEGSPKHTKINPFERGSGGGKPIDVIEPDPNTGIPILWEWNREERSFREIRQVVLMDENGNFHHIRIRTWMRDPQQLRQEIDKLGLGKIRDIRFYASEEDMAWLERLVKGLGMGGEPVWLAPSQPAIIKNPKANVTVTHTYFGPNYIPPVYRIKIAEGLDSLKNTGSKGHFFAYFSDGKVGRYHGEVSELTPMVD